MNPAEVVMGDVQGDRRIQVFQLLGEAQRQPSKPANERADRQIRPLNMGRVYAAHVGVHWSVRRMGELNPSGANRPPGRL